MPAQVDPRGRPVKDSAVPRIAAIAYQKSGRIAVFLIAGPLLLENIRIVLVGTTHPGNIGGAARAMKNMCLRHLVLVSPKMFPHADATARAAGADDILCGAEVFDSLPAAVADCQLVVGTSARGRSIAWPLMTPRECAALAGSQPRSSRIALVFGREHSGLTNTELDCCNYCINIPCNPDFASLNLAAAVQVVAYEMYACLSAAPATEAEPESPLASAGELESLFGHLQRVMTELGFVRAQKSRAIMRRVRRMFMRARLEVNEVNILRGMLSAVQGRKQPRGADSTNGVRAGDSRTPDQQSE